MTAAMLSVRRIRAMKAPPCSRSRGLGRRENAHVDSTDDEHEQPGYRPKAGQRQQSLAPIGPWPPRTQRRIQQAARQHDGGEHECGNHARNDSGDEQRADGCLRHDSVEDEDEAWRDEDPQRPGGRQRAGCEPGIVTVAPHFGHDDGTHGRYRGNARACDGAEAAAGEYR